MATIMTSADLKRIAAEVSIQHGIRLDTDDPMMAVVTLNRMVFEQAVADVQLTPRFRNPFAELEMKPTGGK